MRAVEIAIYKSAGEAPGRLSRYTASTRSALSPNSFCSRSCKPLAVIWNRSVLWDCMKKNAVQTGGLSAAATLAKDHDVLRISAERLNVFTSPLQAVTDVEEPLVSGRCILLACQFRKV